MLSANQIAHWNTHSIGYQMDIQKKCGILHPRVPTSIRSRHLAYPIHKTRSITPANARNVLANTRTFISTWLRVFWCAIIRGCCFRLGAASSAKFPLLWEARHPSFLCPTVHGRGTSRKPHGGASPMHNPSISVHPASVRCIGDTVA